MSKILVADDDPNVIELLKIYLQKEGYEVFFAENGREAVDKANSTKPDLIVLDLMMPEIDGLEVCRQIRMHSRVPIIMLTAKDEDMDKILGLEMGADDYITKPFNPREVVARIKAVLRRVSDISTDSGKQQVLKYNGLEINIMDFTVKLQGREIPFTPKELELLWLLASNPGRVYTREQLLEKVWGYDYFGDSRTVDTHIKRIRKKIGSAEESTSFDIKTVWGVGYKFEVS
ncbi:two component transcriptional regulator, winged helix family [Thermincola ferriacetica]|uniref:Stage 0 sporulation protein A homolog n=2 Tax=Thermincola TaxID=278993 RepID=D5XEL3_THEPJ|nr:MULTISPECIES: response regulator transcription factor [Thermincola]ADG82084.1 two component transcriptional regulator, winged helix family [Thermincola potens JR]KNZ71103.1 two component transcriptional regulator, winged helix family [Thermincola ferriacetica]